MRRSLNTIIGLGIVTALFMAIMSMFYLQQIPTEADLDRLEDEIRREHGLYLSATAELTATLVRPEKKGDRLGVDVECVMRQDLRRRPEIVDLYLGRIAEGVLDHPDWRGRIGYITVRHAPPLDLSQTREAGAQRRKAKPATEPAAPTKKAPTGKRPAAAAEKKVQAAAPGEAPQPGKPAAPARKPAESPKPRR